jgi:hypothetical protein
MGDETKKTKELLVFENSVQPELMLRINPNDGLDLGLVARENTINFVVREVSAQNTASNVTFENGLVYIDNDCKSGTIQISTKLWKKIGKINKALLAIHGENLLVIPR